MFFGLKKFNFSINQTVAGTFHPVFTLSANGREIAEKKSNIESYSLSPYTSFAIANIKKLPLAFS